MHRLLLLGPGRYLVHNRRGQVARPAEVAIAGASTESPAPPSRRRGRVTRVATSAAQRPSSPAQAGTRQVRLRAMWAMANPCGGAVRATRLRAAAVPGSLGVEDREANLGAAARRRAATRWCRPGSGTRGRRARRSARPGSSPAGPPRRSAGPWPGAVPDQRDRTSLRFIVRSRAPPVVARQNRPRNSAPARRGRTSSSACSWRPGTPRAAYRHSSVAIASQLKEEQAFSRSCFQMGSFRIAPFG